ncbi:MAG: hypothetical protein ABFC67_14545 [Mizugakiibacter sp.]|uniref:phage adaptor protein n=1 Tax=Mizugakiibacter sp. TaxID=1972610 RepID=UPI003211014B
MQPHVQGCPTIVVDQAITRAAIEFCQKTGVWRYDHVPVAAVEATTAYSFAPPDGAKVERVLAAWLDGVPLTVKNATDLLGVDDWKTATGTPTHLVVLNDTQFRLYPLGAGSVDLTVTLKPSRAATTIDDAIFEAHVDAIADGAIGKLAALPGKPWSSADLVTYHTGEFDKAIDDATIREFQHAPMRTANPPL